MSWISRKFHNMPNDSTAKAFCMATLVGVTCALTVSATAVLLKPQRQANQEAFRQQRMDTMLSSLPGLKDVLQNSDADTLQSLFIDLNTGTAAEPAQIENFKAQALTVSDNSNAEIYTLALDDSIDIAGIEQRPNLIEVHLLQKKGVLDLLVLPIYGRGYQSTIRAWLTLSGDLNTVVALSVFEQAETPGIGARITETAWQQLWAQKQLHNENGDVALSVVTGKATNANEVDGISGATRTGLGINSMIQFWLGDYGFAPFLDKLRTGEIPMRAS